MGQIVLGVGDYGASNTPGDDVKTFALGSCVSVIFLDPKTRTVGMAHVALPDSSINKAKATEKPGYFADTAVPALLALMTKFGCHPRGKGIVVKLCGGANVMDTNDTFQIGKRNALAIKKILWSYGMGAVSEDLGKNYSRTVSISVSAGQITLSSPGKPNWQL
ncbi:CheD, stimulates methylation of MCP proteins [Desulfuromusa kysingii]|uniref:Probable chemoreceptor glutamine deamidase CheD n=1 Tax=Desulfuromusa kysingii TaxID=37625 RepID=A0A1H4CPP2_9BACT|nr:chemotaxis protein CheD [Desulfuromusa kysingii]SEA62303.1 CheD, stimulates methylation of MCP proteins [Desulfuromusa kysingii]